jgi:hypothetical protein
MTRIRVLTIAAGIVAIALFEESLRVIGADQIADGLAKLGWGGGFAILIITGGRDAVRAFAWTLTIEHPARLAFLRAFQARLAGEALNSLLPTGMVVGEPVKASQAGNEFRSALPPGRLRSSSRSMPHRRSRCSRRALPASRWSAGPPLAW